MIAGMRPVSSSTRAPDARVDGSSRAAAGSGATASNEDRASNASVATSTRSSVPVSCAATASGEHPDERQPGHEYRAASATPETKASRRLSRRSSASADATRANASSSPTVRGQLGSTAQDLRELGGELTSRTGLPPAHETRQSRGEQRHRNSSEREAERQHDGRRR